MEKILILLQIPDQADIGNIQSIQKQKKQIVTSVSSVFSFCVIFCYIRVIIHTLSHFLQMLFTFFSHLCCILLAIEGDELSINIFLFHTRRYESTGLLPFMGGFFCLQNSFIVKRRNETFFRSFPILKKSIDDSQFKRCIQHFLIFSACHLTI